MVAGSAAGQVLPSLGLPDAVNDVVSGSVARSGQLLDGAERLVGERLGRLRDLVRANPRLLDVDDRGAPIVRGELLAISPTAAALDAARRAGFSVRRAERLDELDLTLVTLAVPDGMSARRALRRLAKLDPDGRYEFNHIYSDAGQAGNPVAAGKDGAAQRVGLIDGGVAANHSAFVGVAIEQRGFSGGGAVPSAHGTAVASLLVGRGATLYAADVYCGRADGGSAEAVVKALGWMARERVAVINISLVGPPNATLEAAVRALHARGHLTVAAVGNDGPSAPPLYPASYPDVVAVTGVDSRDRLLPEAGRAKHVDFAAPGAGLLAAANGSGHVEVRGTSFAAPIVAGRLAQLLPVPDRAGAAAAIETLAGRAIDLGARGRDRLYGHGLIGAEFRNPSIAQKKSRAMD